MNWLSKWFRRPPPAWWILDDFFPNLLTGFRVAEYNALLDRFPGLRVAFIADGDAPVEMMHFS